MFQSNISFLKVRNVIILQEIIPLLFFIIRIIIRLENIFLQLIYFMFNFVHTYFQFIYFFTAASFYFQLFSIYLHNIFFLNIYFWDLFLLLFVFNHDENIHLIIYRISNLFSIFLKNPIIWSIRVS